MQMGYLDFCEIGPTRDVFFGPMVDGYYDISSINERIRLSARTFFRSKKYLKTKKLERFKVISKLENFGQKSHTQICTTFHGFSAP